MANPLILAALAGGALWMMFKKPAEKKATVYATGSIEPTAAQTATAAQTVTVPTSVLAPVDTTVATENVPTVTVTPPATTVTTTPAAQTAQQVATQVAAQVIPAIVNQVAQATQAAATTAGVPVITPTVLHSEEVKLDQDPHGTIALAKSMINAESLAGWKTALSNDIKAWQARMGLTADGKFGPKSALKMAEEVGILPLVRYYASTGGTKAQQVTAYRTSVGTVASNVYATNPAHSISLRSSQNYEQGQGYVTSPAAVPASSRLTQATELAGNLKVA
jgi:hypothetical protein